MKTITREELKAKIDRGDDFVLFEVLSEAKYRQAHLPGAVRYPGKEGASGLLPDRSTEVVTYCSNFN